VLDILKTHFKLNEFRRGQREIINSVLEGRDALAVLPTGGGKSLCYQYAAVARNQMVVVVSPLIALMQDQVEGLRRLGIPAGCVHSGQSLAEKRDVFRQIAAGGPFVLYLSPERTQKDGFQSWIRDMQVGLFAIDEAHCVSQWGHDFRADYSQLKILKTLRPGVPVLALTASATPFVLNDIALQLGMTSPARHVHGFYRPNLYYQVEDCRDEDEKMAVLRQALKQTPEGRIIIYCGTRKSTEEIAAALSSEHAQTGYYHAGMSADQRSQTQQAYADGRIRILIATNAFGMGIDHPDVRLVVHFHMPANLDSLYQEMGRAGRDGAESTCLMLYAKKDKGLQVFFIQKSQAPERIQNVRWRALENLIGYSEGGECRHSEILTYYQDAQRLEKCGHCDVCAPASPRRIQRPATPLKTLLRKVKGRKTAAPDAIVLTPEESRIFEILRLWRKEKARELDVPAFVVFSDRTLRHMAQVNPKSMDELRGVYGLGEVKVERFGPELLSGPLHPD
jgi:ATP-dependent DNA helicase RecQ